VIKKDGIVYFVEKSRIGFPRIEVSKKEDHVYVITPHYPIDYRVRYRTPVLNGRYHAWLLQKVKALGISFDLVFTFDHTSYLITGFFDNVIYYCGDDFIGNAKISLPWINAFHRRIERRLSERAKLVIVTSDYLYSRHIQFNANTHTVPLGAPTIERPYVYHPSGRETPVLGIVAFLNYRMPLDVFDAILKKFKVILIGPADATFRKRYEGNENAVFVGTKHGDELYKALADVDVCIAPYAEQKINKGVTPNKLWLYLALGKPSVVTSISNIRNWHFDKGLVYICNNEQFSENCQLAFVEDSEELARRRVELSRRNSWDSRVQEILNLYYQRVPLKERTPSLL
jgi:hypothetical protein